MLYLYVWSFLQIIFESLPISSSGNVILWSICIARLANWFQIVEISKNIDFIMHGPTLIIIVIFFRKQLLALYNRCIYEDGFIKKIVMFMICADSVTCTWFLWFAYYKVMMPLWIGFLITALFLFSLTLIKKDSTQILVPSENYQGTDISWSMKNGLLLGFLQGIALMPGVSRFALTFVGARWLQFSAYDALFVSFLLQMPLIGAAFVKGIWSVHYEDMSNVLGTSNFMMIVGGATCLSYVLFIFVSRMAYRQKLHLFAWYMVLIAGAAWYWGL